MAANGGIASALLRTVVETLDLCAPCKNRIFATDAPTTNGESATDKSRLLEKEDIAAAEHASLAQGSTTAGAVRQTTAEDGEIEGTTSPHKEAVDIPDTDPDTTTISTSPTHDLDIKFCHSRAKMQLRRTGLRSVALNRCTWSNVTFTDCNLSNVVFNDVILTNAHFYNLDFADITITNIELENVEWTDQFLEQAVLSKESEGTRAANDESPTSQQNEILFPILSSKSTILTRGGSKAGGNIGELAAFHRQARAGLKRIRLSPAAEKTIYNLPDSILAIIFSYLLPEFTCAFFDPCQREVREKAEKLRHRNLRTTYEHGLRRVTYFAKTRNPPFTLRTAVLYVSRRFYSVAAPYLYDRKFFFRTHKMCLAFLHDHQRREHKITIVGINSDRGNVESLRLILDVMLQDRAEIKEIVFKMGTWFWETYNWKSALASLLALRDYKVLTFQDFHQLQNVIAIFQLLAKLPLKHGGHNLVVDISIAGHEETADRTAFLAALKLFVQHKRALQPESQPPERNLTCKEKQLEKCCHWNRQGTGPFKRYDLLRLPDNALKRILQYLFPMDNMKVLQNPRHVAVRWRYKQTTYKIMSTSLATTYLGWKDETEENNMQPTYTTKAGIAVNFLRVNRQCNDLGTPYLYSRGIHFDANPGTCLAFLHDHRRSLHKVEAITLEYNQKSSCDIWRRLFNVLVHNRPDLSSLTVRVGSSFWTAAPWQTMSASSTMNWKGWCQIVNGRPCCGDRTFLIHVARIAARDKAKNDIHVKLEIEGSELDMARTNFLKKLNDEVARTRLGRPNVTIRDYGTCYRNGTMDDDSDDEEGGQKKDPVEMQLEKTCYWEEGKKCAK